MEVKNKQVIFKQIGLKISRYRSLREMNQEDLANKINISKSAISKIERGQYNNNIGVGLLFDIAWALDIDVTMLLTFEDIEKEMW